MELSFIPESRELLAKAAAAGDGTSAPVVCEAIRRDGGLVRLEGEASRDDVTGGSAVMVRFRLTDYI